MKFLSTVRNSIKYLIGFVLVVLAIMCLFRIGDYYLFHTSWFTETNPWYMQLVYWALQALVVVAVLTVLFVLVRMAMINKNGGMDPVKQQKAAKKEISQSNREGILWSARKRNALGLPWTFTKYSLDEDRLYVQSGFLNTKEDEIRLYRITDVTLMRNLWQKMLGLGTIHCDSSDATMKNFNLKNVKKSKQVKNMVSELVDRSRAKNRVYTTESVNGHLHQAEGQMPPIDRTDANGNGIPDSLE